MQMKIQINTTPKKKKKTNKQTINKNKVKTLCKENLWL